MAVSVFPESLNLARVASAMRGSLLISVLFVSATCKADKSGGPTATQLSFRAQPQHTMAGSTFAPVRVVVRDDKGKDVTDFREYVTLSIGTNPGGGTLGGTTTVQAIAGVATFDDLTIDKSGGGYRLLATAGGLVPATSSRFDVTPGPATHLVITVEPTTSTAGSNIGPAIRVAARDALDNVADGFTGDITITMSPGTGSPGATLSGTTTVTATAGVAVFSALSIDKTGSGYRLSVAAANVVGTTSAAFDITPGSASQLVVTQQPTTITAGDPISPAVVIIARDAWGNSVPNFTGNVTLDITAGTGTPGANLLGTRIVAAVGGIATFTTLSVNRTGSAYTLSARASGLVGATTAPFDVTPGAVSQLVFVSPPITTTAGVTIPSVQVAAQDSLGNTVENFADAVTIAISANPGGGTLSGTTTMAAVAGVATFSTLSIDKSGTGYRLVASAGSLNRTCGAFSITAGTATDLIFTTQPSPATARATISPSVRVVARDVLGNIADGFNGEVTVALTAGTGTDGAALFGTTTVTASAGVAIFTNLSIDKAGSGYTLAASAAGLTGSTSTTFAVSPAPASLLVFTTQPRAAIAGDAIAPAVVVTARDPWGNTATEFTGNVTVELTAGTGTGGANLLGTRTVAAVAGIATFSTLSITRNGTGYTLSARSSGLAGTTSSPFDISTGPVTQLVFTAQPITTTAGLILSPIQVVAQDSLGNTAPGFTGDVSLSIGVNPGGGTLAGTTTVAAVAGVANFSTLSIDKSGTGYRLVATSGSLARTSGSFSITAGVATQLGIIVQPGTTTAGANITPPVRVAGLDAFGNIATSFAGAVTLTLEANPASGALSGTTTVVAASGVAVFSAVSIDKAGSGYRLRATSSGLAPASTAPFEISPAAPTQLVFTVQPSATTAGATITPAIQVTARDALGNTASAFVGTVTLAITAGTGTPGAALTGTRTVGAVGGSATFSTLSIDKSGTSYTLTATASGLPGAVSVSFTITAGTATQLAFTAQPVTTTAGVILSPIQVVAQDSLGNTVPDFTAAVTMTIGTNPGGATLSGTTTVNAVGGVAIFSTLSIDKTGTGYRLAATWGSLTRTSGAFSITPGTASQLNFTVQPATTTAGATMSPAVRVAALDAFGNTATSFTGTVTIAIGTNPAAGVLSGTKAVAAVSGVATFSTLSIDKAGNGYTLAATSSALTATTSAAFDIVSATVTQLVFIAQPVTTTAGATFAPVQVAAQDALGNTVPGFTDDISLTIATNPGGGTLAGTTTVTAVGGVATFSTLSIDKSATGYRLAATSGSLTRTSGAFSITAGTVTQLIFTVQPVTATAGANISPAVRVAALDAFGNTATNFTGAVTIGIGNNPGSGTLSGTSTVVATAGVAVFSTLRIDKAGSGYTLAAAAAGTSDATSAAFDITPGTATHLSFTLQPSATTAGSVITPAIQVSALDAFDNTATSFIRNITVELTGGTGTPGAVLSGTRTIGAVAGVATFATLSLDQAGSGYTLTAIASGLTGTISAPFAIGPAPATELRFIVQPTHTIAGESIAPPVAVSARDVLGNVVTTFTGDVTVALTTSSGATLSGPTTVAAVAGVATFSALSVDKSGSGYKLAATADSLTPDTSASFTVTPGPATQLMFTVSPTTTSADSTISPAVKVTALDGLGNVATSFTGTVTVAIGTNPAGGTLSGTTAVAAVAGVAVFSTLSIDKVGSNYTLSATAVAVTEATSTPFNVTPGPATQLTFTVQPGAAIAGDPISPAVVVTVLDAFGNTATDFAGNVTVELTAGTGTPGANLLGTRTVAAVSGVATFSTLSVNRSGTGYALFARASGLTGAPSTPFDVAPGAVTQLVFTTQPVTATAGAILSPVQVAAEDSLGNTVPAFADAVTLTIGTNPGGGTLSGSTTVTAVAGVATFSTLSIDKSGTGYRLAAASGSLTRTSGAFSITPDAATQLSFTVEPVTTTAGATITPAVRVAALDAFGNAATSFTGTVTIAIGTNPASGTLSGTTAVTAVSGVAVFSTLRIDKVGSGYALSASATGLTGVTSPAFDITPASASLLVFSVQPAAAIAGDPITPAVVVTARDAFGNTATSFTGNVTVDLTVGTGTPGANLQGTRTVAAVAGVATFPTISVNRSGTGYTLVAKATGVPDATSSPFDVAAAAVAQLVFATQPVTTTAGATFAPLQVVAQDSLGNTVSSFSDAISLTIGTNPGGGTLTGTTTVAAVGGVATFSTLSIDKSGTGYRLVAASGSLTRTSGAFSIVPGAPSQLGFTVQPPTATAGATISPAVRVAAQDEFGNTVTSFIGSITIAIGTNPAGGVLTGTRVVAASAGVAVFSSLRIDRAGGGYTLAAMSPALTGTTSATFDVVPAPVTQLAFITQPVTTAAGATFTPVQVAAQDSLGNTVPNFTDAVTLSIGTNPAGGTLAGTTTVTAVGGVATFSTLSIDKSGVGYRLAATAGSMTRASGAFSITPGAGTQLSFTVQPATATAGAVLTPAVRVTALDAFGNTATSFTGTVTIAIGTNPSSGTLSGTTAVTAVSGVAAFSTLRIDKVGSGYTLVTAADGLTEATSTAFGITPAPASLLVFTVQPAAAIAGDPITPAVVVTARDAFGNTATGFTGNVTVDLTAGTGTPGANLLGARTVAAVAGVTTFPTLNVNRSGIGYTLSAKATGLADATSNPFDVAAAAVAQLVFTTQPITTTAGATFAPVQVTAQDSLGNIVSNFTDAVTMTIGTNPGGGTLSGTTSVSAVAGIATFSTLSIDKSATGYRLAAASGSLTRTSGAFSITPDAPAQLSFTVQPVTATAGATISPAVRVAALDAFGNNATNFTGTVTIAIGSNPAVGVLSGTTSLAAVNGAAVFSTLSIDKVGGGYTLSATAAGLTGATSAAFSITPAPASLLAFTVQPAAAIAGDPISPAVVVTARDAFGNTATSFTGNVTVDLTVGTGTPGANLQGTRTVAAVAGVATFPTISVNRSGTGYTLVAKATGVPDATSSPFDVAAAAVAQLVFTTQPVTTTAGATFTPVQVAAQDSLGNTVPDFTDAVTLSIGTNPGGGTLAGTTTVAAVSGVATFSTLSIDKSGTGYRLAATAGSLTRTSGAFSVTAGAATQLSFTVQPVATTAGATISPAVRVAAQDDFGNAVTSFTGTITIAIGTNPAGGVLSGTRVIAASAGVALFSTLRIDKAGSGYTLAATSPTVTGTTSAAFDIVSAPVTQLVFIAQPVTTTAGATFTPVRVAAQDSLGNTVPGFTDDISLTIGTNPAGGTLAGTTTVSAVGGVATFSTLSIDKSATGYRLAATSGSLTRTSAAFSVTPGTASQLSFTAQPVATTAGATMTPAVRVAALDALGNTATSFTGAVTIAIGSNPGGGTLTGTTTVVATSGVAVFSTLRIDKSGSGYTLAATAENVTGTTSSAFVITPAAATQLAFTLQPSATTAGSVITPAIQVSARDAFGNTATTFISNITVVVTGGTGTPGAVLSGARTIGAVAGVATFATLSLDKAGSGYTLTATTSGLTGSVSAPFTITSGSATELLFTMPPTNAIAGASIAPPVQVTARDGLGNLVTSFTSDVTVALTTSSGATLSGQTTVAAVAGVATFSTLSVDKSGSGYKLAASATGLSPDTSASFAIAAGPATQLSFTVSPTTAGAGTTISPAVRVAALDGLGNVATTFTGSITVAIGSNPAGGTLSGTTTVTAVGGVAVFSTLSIDNVGSNYTLSATTAGLTGTTSAQFNVTPGSGSVLVFTVQPSGAIAGDPITPAVLVTARDALGNTVTNFTGNVTVELSAGTGTSGASLLGTRTVAAVGGVATFSTLSINRSGTGYTLFARASGLTGATSTPFDVAAGAVTQLAFTAPPITTSAGETFTPVQVTAQDSLGNTVAGFTNAVTMAIGTNPGGGTLSGTTTVTPVGGVATFSTLSIDKSATGYRLVATSGSLTRTSSAFSITAAGASQLSFSASPVTSTAGTTFTPAVRVVALDDFGNTSTTFTGTVTVAIGTNPAGGTLAGTKTVAAVNGVAVFSTLSIDRVGAGYTLRATAPGLTEVTSPAFDIVTAVVTQLVFTAQPATTAAGVTLPPVQVAARDSLGNTVPDFTGDVTLTISTNPGGGTLAGTTTVAAVGGVATFSTLSIDKSGVGYRLAATSGFLTRASGAFSITPGPATRLAVTVSPATTTAGANLSPALRVAALDDFGNTVPSFTGTVTVAIGTNPASGTLSGTTAVAAVGGIAVFSSLSIDKAGSGYTLQVTAPGLAPATSTAFDITVGAATHLAFTLQPSTTTAGATITPAIEVVARDALGNTATSFLNNVTVVLTGGTGTPGATLSGTRTIGAAAGVATFSTLSIDKSGSGYTLTATASGLTGVVSAPFTITAGAVTQLVFTAQPVTTTAGLALPPVQVAARDSLGNTVSSFTDPVTLTIGVNPGGGTLAGTTTVNAVAGVATFSTLSIDKTGTGYRLAATSGGGSLTRTSGAFSITPATATRLSFTVQPIATTAGVNINPAVRVAAFDALGNAATGFTGTVNIGIGTNPASGLLSGTTAVAAVNGVAVFSTLSIDKAGSGYTLSATADGLTGSTSATFDVTSGAATHLTYAVQPSTATAGATIAPALEVVVRDALGNTVTTFTGNVTVELTAGTGTPGANLLGTRTVAAVGGVATFSTLSINRSGTGYTLFARASGLTGVTSVPFDVTPGAVTQLTFTAQPVTTTAGATFTPVQVTAQDSLDNTVSNFTNAVTLTIGTNPGGGTLAGTTTVTAVGGVATFSTLSIDKSGTGYRLVATSGGLTRTSTAFSITPSAATHLSFTVQPVTTTAGVTLSPAVRVAAQDDLGNTVTSFTGTITIDIGTNPAGGVLSGTKVVTASAGVAVFSNLRIDRGGSGYTLAATAPALTEATSDAFDIINAPLTQLTFITQPVTTTAGAPLMVEVAAQDSLGNTLVDFTDAVTLTIGTNPGGGTLAGTTTVTAVAGVATFSNLSIDKSGTGYRLLAEAGGLTRTSGAFSITPGAATQLSFSAPPTTTTAGANISPAVRVAALDNFGNPATTFTGTVAIAIGSNPGGGTLGGTQLVAAVNGVAVFSTLNIDKAGIGYTLRATASGLTSTTSGGFDITSASATQLVFTVQPSVEAAGAAIAPAVQVTARDAFGNTATTFLSNVTVAITGGTGTPGAVLSGTRTVGAVAGVATFSTLSIDKSGAGYTLTATASGLTGTISTAFTINPGNAVRLGFTVQPTSMTAGVAITPAVRVAAQDAFGNTVTGFTSNVTVAIAVNPGGGTLSGTRTVAASAGVATFSTLSIDKSGTGYRLAATATGLAPDTSSAFSIAAATATRLAFTVQPTATMAGDAISPAVRVTAQDAFGNAAPGFGGNVTMAIASNPSGGTLTGTTTVMAVSGVATFANLSINRSGTGYTLRATATGLTQATSSGFEITAGPATQLAFTVQPSSEAAGAAITPAVQVTARDALGNRATTFLNNITVAITGGTGTPGAVLSGTRTVGAVAGVATFSTLSIDKSGPGYTLTATASGLTGAISTAFTINPGTANRLIFTVEPSSMTAGATITPAVRVAAQDAFGNTVTGFNSQVTVAIAVNPGGGTLSGTRTVNASQGVATFSTLSIDKSGTGYRLAATATGLAPDTSGAFSIAAGTATRLAFTVQPSSVIAGVAISPAVRVSAQDNFGNTAPAFSGTITMAIGVNPAGGVLTGTTAVTAASGVSVFSNLRIDQPGTGYTLQATTTGLTQATSSAFNVTLTAAPVTPATSLPNQ